MWQQTTRADIARTLTMEERALAISGKACWALLTPTAASRIANKTCRHHGCQISHQCEVADFSTHLQEAVEGQLPFLHQLSAIPAAALLDQFSSGSGMTAPRAQQQHQKISP